MKQPAVVVKTYAHIFRISRNIDYLEISVCIKVYGMMLQTFIFYWKRLSYKKLIFLHFFGPEIRINQKVLIITFTVDNVHKYDKILSIRTNLFCPTGFRL